LISKQEGWLEGKEKAGAWAASQVSDGMRVGLGTGSTAAFFTRHLARRIQGEGLKVQLVSSSLAAAFLAEDLGLTLLPLDSVHRLDLYADGADEVDGQKRLLKGRGAAMTREKILARLADRFLVLIDPAKKVEKLGTRFPVPLEVLPCARALVIRELQALGASEDLRTGTGKDGPVVTDQGNLVLDARFKPGTDVAALEGELDALPGVVGHGLFTRFADRITVAVGGDAGVAVEN
jgi:ribose 5-phosphate isomerase A